MLVKAMIRTKEKVGDKTVGYVPGDIIYFWPFDSDHGRLTFNSLMAVVVDIDIPCDFDKQPPDCPACKFNDPASCDNIKFTRGEWSGGDVLNPPTLLRKSRYNIDRAKIISSETEKIVEKTIKTEEEKELLLARALNNIQLASVIDDKTTAGVKA